MAVQTKQREEEVALAPPSAFPNLHPEINEEEAATTSKYGVAYVGSPARTTEDEIIWGWAVLMRAYGAGDSVTFGVNSRYVTVDFDQKKTWFFDYPTELLAEHKDTTAIYFEKVSPKLS